MHSLRGRLEVDGAGRWPPGITTKNKNAEAGFLRKYVYLFSNRCCVCNMCCVQHTLNLNEFVSYEKLMLPNLAGAFVKDSVKAKHFSRAADAPNKFKLLHFKNVVVLLRWIGSETKFLM